MIRSHTEEVAAKMDARSPKERALEAVQKLPPNATFEDAMERLYLLAKIERGLAQVEAGDVIPHDQAKDRLTK